MTAHECLPAQTGLPQVPLLASRTKGKLHPDEPPPANGMIGGLESFLGGMTIPAACLPSMPFPVTSSKALKVRTRFEF